MCFLDALVLSQNKKKLTLTGQQVPRLGAGSFSASLRHLPQLMSEVAAQAGMQRPYCDLRPSRFKRIIGSLQNDWFWLV
jgi:hypothetical protein